jgi:hypothetical protein
MLSEEQDLSEAEVNGAMVTLRTCALANADEEGAVEIEVDIIDVNWIPDAADVIEAGGFVKPKGWRGGGAGGKPDRLRGVGRLSNGLYMAKLCFKNGSEKIVGNTFTTSAEAARAWDHAVIRQYGGNITSDCLNYNDSFDDVLLLLSRGQIDDTGTAREPFSEHAIVREGDHAADVGVRGALAVLHKYFRHELLAIRALVCVLPVVSAYFHGAVPCSMLRTRGLTCLLACGRARVRTKAWHRTFGGLRCGGCATRRPTRTLYGTRWTSSSLSAR